MFRKYGIIGLIFIILVEINFFFQIEPFARWYFPIIWFGYIFLIDAIVYSLKKSSIIMNKRKQFFLMLGLSSIVWWGFEIINYLLQNWSYENTASFFNKKWIVMAVYTVASIRVNTTMLMAGDSNRTPSNVWLAMEDRLPCNNKMGT